MKSIILASLMVFSLNAAAQLPAPNSSESKAEVVAQINARQKLIDSIQSQISDLESSTGVVAGIQATVDVGMITLGLGKTAWSKLARVWLVGLGTLGIGREGYNFVMAKKDLPGLKIRLAQEQAYVDILRSRVQ